MRSIYDEYDLVDKYKRKQEDINNMQKIFLKAKSVEQIKYLQEQGYDLYAQDEKGKDVLSKAQTAKQTEMLLEIGGFSEESIIRALYNANSEEQTKLLLKQNPPQDKFIDFLDAAKTEEQMTLLYDRIASENIEKRLKDGKFYNIKLLGFLQKKGYDVQECADKLLKYQNDLKKVEDLIALGVSKKGLAEAFNEGTSYEKAKLLVASGGSPEDKDYDKLSWKFEVFRNATTLEYMQLLIDACPNTLQEIFHNKFSFKQDASIDVIKLCVEKGVNPNQFLFSAKTAEETEYLLQNGANVNTIDDYDKTNALWGANLEKTEVLLAHHINVNQINENGENVLYSLKDSEVEKARLIIKAGIEVLPTQTAFSIYEVSPNLREIFLEEEKRRNHIETVRKKVAKMHEEGVSGVVVADKIGDKMRSGEVEKTVTPKYARDELAPQIREEIKNRKIKHQ